MIPLGELCAALGGDLEPVRPLLSTRSLTGVHISELGDPTTYLDGGELLLTTGIPLRGADAGIREYVRRLKAKGVLALGLGLGPVLNEIPPALERACRDQRFDLLVIPPRTGFQRVSRAYWSLSERDGQADLVSSLGAQTALARAATRLDAVSAVVRGLAQALGGWAAYLPGDGTRTTCWPDNAQPIMGPLHTATRDLHREASLSPRTFALLGHTIVEYPIASDGRVHGFLTVSPGRTLTPANRQVIATVCMLLAIKAHQRDLAAGVTATFASGVAKLLARGHTEAARILAEDAGLPELPECVRVLALSASSESRETGAAGLVRAARRLDRDAGIAALPRGLGRPPLHFTEGSLTIVLLPARPEHAEHPDLGSGAASCGERGYHGGAVENLRGVVSPVVDVAEIPAALPALRQSLVHTPPGRLGAMACPRGDSRAREWVQRLEEYPRAELLPSVREYLRHLGRWEDASRVLGVHRNTLRHRVAVAEQLLGVTLTDPDVLASLWPVLDAPAPGAEDPR